MLRVTYTDVMGKAFLSLHCINHGDVIGHVLYSAQSSVGLLQPAQQLALLADFMERAQRAWVQGRWEFTDEC